MTAAPAIIRLAVGSRGRPCQGLPWQPQDCASLERLGSASAMVDLDRTSRRQADHKKYDYLESEATFI